MSNFAPYSVFEEKSEYMKQWETSGAPSRDVIYHNQFPQASRGERKIAPMQTSSISFQDIRKPISTQPGTALGGYHDYMTSVQQRPYDPSKNLGLGMPVNSSAFMQESETSQRKRSNGVVQSQFHQSNNYFFQNFETLNHISQREEEINHYMARNPVNTRRDEMEKTRLQDKKQFMNQQGGTIHNFADLTPMTTRSMKGEGIQQNRYIPNGRTQAIPKNLL
jgi:hypothetical protein